MSERSFESSPPDASHAPLAVPAPARPDAGSPEHDVLELRSGALRLALRPDLGGCIAGLWHHHVPVLRSTEPHALQAACDGACIAVLPFVDRLGYRRFRWRGTDFTLRAEGDANAHATDGCARLQRWTVRSHGPNDAVLALAHEADDHWPFAFAAEQFFSLTPQALRLQLVVTNTDSRVQPIGLGWAPHFPRRLRSRLHLEIAERWEHDAAGLPTRKVAQPGVDGDLAYLAFDHVFEGWRGSARLRDETFRLQLGSSLSRLVVRTAPEAASFSVGPCSQVANALHMADPLAHGIVALEPGQSCEAWMKLDVSPI